MQTIHILIKSILQLSNSQIGISFISIFTCLCFYFYNFENKTLRVLIRVIYFSIFIFAFYSFLSIIKYRLHSFQVWDFTSFYLWAKVAVQGYNFYLPENSQFIFNTLSLPTENFKEFIDGIVHVGFLYPPPTMFYFYLLGYLNYNSALIVWTLFITLFLIACIYIIYKLYFREFEINGFVLVIILILINPTVKSTIIFSQTNFIVLFYLLLMRRYSNHKSAGVMLALAFFTKPFMLIFGIYFLLSRNWKAISYFLVSSLVLSGITIIAFGIDTFMSYFFNNATQRIPAWQFSEDINQSLHAVLLRANLISLDKPYIFFIISSTLLAITIQFSRYLLKKKLVDHVWALLLLVGLLIYPGTLSYYGVVLLFIIFQFFNKERPLGLDYRICIPVIAILFYLSSVSVFASICFLLIIVIFKSLWQIIHLNSSISPQFENKSAI